MRVIRVTKSQTKSFNILNKLYKLTSTGDKKVSNYCNRYFKPLSINNINYTKQTGA